MNAATTQLIARVIAMVVAKMMDPVYRARLEGVAVAYNDLVREVMTSNPKEDGTPWTDAELEAIGAETVAIAEGTKTKLQRTDG
jgi:hypothetical protein